MAKDVKSGIRKPSDAEVMAATVGHPFKRCVCGASIAASQPFCYECRRLVEIGWGPVPRRGGLGQPEPQIVGGTDQDTQEKQSYDAFNRSGYSDTIPTGKIPPSKERA